jgi:hypothetical protein
MFKYLFSHISNGFHLHDMEKKQEAGTNAIMGVSVWREEDSILLATVLQDGKDAFAASRLTSAKVHHV